MKLQSFKISIIIFATLIVIQPALAADAVKTTETKPVEDSVNELLTVRDDTSLSDAEKLVKELELRKKILSEVLSLSLDEVSKLTAKINSLPEFAEDSRERALQDEYKAALESYAAYYTEQSKKLGELTTIDEVKSLAQEIKDYRDNTYNPQVQQIVNFVLIFYNENVLKLATTRLDKITADIEKLEKLGYIKPDTFVNELKQAAEILNSARALLEEAKSAVLAPPEEPTLEAGATEDTPPPVEPNKLIESSLNKIKDTYDIFLQVSKSLREILGL